MKSLLLTLLFAMFFGVSMFAQTVPSKTLVKLIATKDFNGKILKKEGGSSFFKVAEDVLVDGQKVIAANTPVEVKLVKDTRSDFKVEMTEVKGVQGTIIKLHDCWLYTTIDENRGKPKGPIFRAGTRKICYTF